MMPKKKIAQPLRRQMLLSILAIAVFGTLPVFVVGMTSVNRINREAAAREEVQAAAAVRKRFDRLAVEQRSATVWDEAVVKVVAADTAWMDNNLGIWMQSYFGHEMNFVLQPNLAPIYAAVDRETRSPKVFDEVAGSIAPLAAAAREMLLRGETDPEDIAVTSYVALASGPAIASVVPIIPDTEALEVSPPRTYFHVAIDRVDEAYVASVTDGLALAAPSIGGEGSGGLGTISMKDARGTEVAQLKWTPSSPASDLVSAILPALAIWFGAGAFLVVFLTRRLIGTSDKLEESEAHARYLALHDPLTRLPNRALFEDRLRQALAIVERGGADVTLLMIDLDRFKAVNDRLGHPAGDELIRQVGARLAGRIRRSDTVARLGGDEFAVVLVGEMDAGALDTFCEEMIADISRPYDLLGDTDHISASIGVSRARPKEDADELIRCADIALYQAKHMGRERHCLFLDEMDNQMRVQGQMERDLRADIETAALRLGLACCPIMDRQERLVGVAAIFRWDHPSHGRVEPDVLFSIAQERGFAKALARHLLDEVCSLLVRPDIPGLVLHVSDIQMRDTSFAQTVLGRLDEADIPPERLELRMPIEAIDGETSSCRSQLKMLDAAGVAISLNEAATARFDLQRARDIGVSALTIGRSSIDPIVHDPAKKTRLQAMIAFARAVGLRVSAAGVRTSEERESLSALGFVTFAQDDAYGMTVENVVENYGSQAHGTARGAHFGTPGTA